MNIAKDLVKMSFATLIIALAVFFFLIPSSAAVSSISGLAIVLSNFIPLPISAITMGLNVGLLVIGFLICGNEFGFKTVYTSVLLPLYLALLEWIFPNNQSLTKDATLDVVCYICLVSVGLAILFNMNASSGGLDIVAKIINKFTRMDLGKAMSLSGMVVALSSAFFYDTKIVVLSVLGTYFNGLILDHFIFGQNMKRRVCIVSLEKSDQIQEWIIHSLHSGCSVYEMKGGYNNVVRKEIIVIVDNEEYRKLMNYVIAEDPKAFMTVYNVNAMRYTPKK